MVTGCPVNTQIYLLSAHRECFPLFPIQLQDNKILAPILVLRAWLTTACQFGQLQLHKHDVTLSGAGQNRTSVDVKFTPLEWSPALYSWQGRGFPAELHQLCVNNQGLTCGVKPRNWSDTSKRRPPPSLSRETLHGASKTDRRGGRFIHTHRHRRTLRHSHTHTHIHTFKHGAEEGGNGVPRLDDTVGVPILS